MKNYSIFKKILHAGMAVALFAPAMTLSSCENDDSAGAPYLRLERPSVISNTSAVARVPSYSEIGFDIAPILAAKKLTDNPDSLQAHTTPLISYDIRSNRDWVVFVEGDNAEWLHVYPSAAGSGDGRIFFGADNNYSTDARSTTLYIRYANGKYSDVSIAVTQRANLPFLYTRVNGADARRVTVGAGASVYRVDVLSNVDYFYSAEGGFFSFTEDGNGLFTLSVDAYPDSAAELERSGAINFRGAGEFSGVTGSIEILQTIRPAITAKGLTNNTINFKAADTSVFSFSVSANYDWEVAVSPADDWYTVTPLKGLAGETVTVLVTPKENVDDARSGQFTVTTDERNGVKATLLVTVKQASGGGGSGGGMTGLQEPVKWFFDGTTGTDYTVPTQQFAENNSLPAKEGVGYLSYTHTYADQTGIDDPDCKRLIGGTGQPYVTGAWPGDYWLFEVPVTRFEAGTKVRFSGVTRTSATGQHYWLMEFCDGTGDNDWKPVIATQTATVGGAEITYTYAIPSIETNMAVDFTVTYSKPIANGSVKFRMTCVANWQTNGAGALGNPNGGTIRWASSAGTGYTDSPVIEVVD